MDFSTDGKMRLNAEETKAADAALIQHFLFALQESDCCRIMVTPPVQNLFERLFASRMDEIAGEPTKAQLKDELTTSRDLTEEIKKSVSFYREENNQLRKQNFDLAIALDKAEKAIKYLRKKSRNKRVAR